MALTTLVVEVFALLSTVGFAGAAINLIAAVSTTTQGKTIRPWCDVTGGETFDGWYNPKGQQITTDTNQRKHVESLGNRHFLVIKHVDPANDGGIYECRGNTNKDTFTLNIGFIATPPLNQKLTLDEPGLIRLEAHGYPTPNYAWKKDGNALDPASKPRIILQEDGSLKISKVEIADEGKYDCHISEAINSKDVSIQVSVIQKPKITVSPQMARVLTEGYNTTFKCNATGRPEPTIKWIDQNGRTIDTVVDQRYSVSGGYLTITGVVKKDADNTYTCEAKNADGDDTATATISKIWVAPKLKPLSDQTKNKEEKVTLLCEATAGDVPIVVVWKKDGHKFRDQNQQSDKSTIIFERVDVENSGKYTCEATNGAKDDNGNTIVIKEEVNLYVKSPPKLNKQKSTSPVYSFVDNPNPVKIVCEFFGYPLPNITMTRNGTELAVGVTTVTYEIKDTKEDSFQTFHCLAINKNGNASHTVELKRAVAPEAVKNLKGITTCKSITVKWNQPNFDGGMSITKYDIKIQNENGTEVVALSVDAPSTEYTHVQDIKKEEQYKIEVFARSAFPKRGSTETVTVTTAKYCAPSKPTINSFPPAILMKLKFKLTWTRPDSDGGDPVIKYRVSYQSYVDGKLKENRTIGETVETEMEIDDEYLVAGRTFSFKVTAINKGGESDAGSLRLTVSPEAGPTTTAPPTTTQPAPVSSVASTSSASSEPQAPTTVTRRSASALPDGSVTDTTSEPEVGARTQDGLSAGVIAAIVIVIILIILIAIDLFCCYFNGCGLFFCCHKTFCGGGGGSTTKHKDGKSAKTSEMEKLKPAPEHV